MGANDRLLEQLRRRPGPGTILVNVLMLWHLIALTRLLIGEAPARSLVQDIRRRHPFLWRRGNPLAAFPGRDAHHVHHVHFLERLALALEDEKVDYEDCSEQAACKDIAVRKVDVASDEWGEKSCWS